jgi:glycerate kinase
VRVVLAPNAFKGSFDGVAVARAWAEALAGRAETRLAPMSDGGDGFLAVVRYHRPRVLEVAARVRDPLGHPVAARWGWDPEGGAAYLESAAAIGLRLVERERRAPLMATTAGLGRLIRTAAGLGPAELVVGLGGSATVDGGLGMARALGYRFEDQAGGAIERPADLPRLARIARPEEPPLPDGVRVLALADVTAPLHGPDGAARAYGPQKGADPAAVERLAEGLERMAEAWREDLAAPVDLTRRPGAGAAGGLGAALVAFLGAELVPGSEWCAELAGLDAALVGADGLVTGEGRFDRQSLRGKATGRALEGARAAGVRAAVVCGVADAGAGAGDVLVVEGSAVGRGREDRLDTGDLARLVGLVLDRWEAILPPR